MFIHRKLRLQIDVQDTALAAIKNCYGQAFHAMTRQTQCMAYALLDLMSHGTTCTVVVRDKSFRCTCVPYIYIVVYCPPRTCQCHKSLKQAPSQSVNCCWAYWRSSFHLPYTQSCSYSYSYRQSPYKSPPVCYKYGCRLSIHRCL